MNTRFLVIIQGLTFTGNLQPNRLHPLEFADATVPEPAGSPAHASPAPHGRARPSRRGGTERPVPARAPRRRLTGTKQRLVSIFRQGLAVLLSVLMAGHALPKPTWKPEPWLELRCAVGTSPQQPPTPIPKSPSL